LEFHKEVYGKWILSGEHAVLRGGPALVFPVKSRSFRLDYQEKAHDLKIQLLGGHSEDFQLIIWGVIERACDQLGFSRSQLKGLIQLRSDIPAGAGMGASAALCVAITLWLKQLGHVPSGEEYETARKLENLFHGESSGVDVAVCLSNQGLKFSRSGERDSVDLQWSPYWYLSYTGQRGVTKDCVQQVKALFDHDYSLATSLDQRMNEATALAETALKMDEASGFEQLLQAIRQAGSCFHEWGLCSGAVKSHLEELTTYGARAVKLTGSGNGGYALSLWKEPPPDRILQSLIPV
jgi:mevalonate kinase